MTKLYSRYQRKLEQRSKYEALFIKLKAEARRFYLMLMETAGACVAKYFSSIINASSYRSVAYLDVICCISSE